MPASELPPPRAVCNGCGAEAELSPEQCADPDAAVVCAPDSGCCQEDHGPGGHAGDVCDRTLTITAYANLIATTQG